VTLSPPLDHDQMELDVLGERRNAELLIREAKRRQRRRRSLIVTFVIATVLVIATTFFAVRSNKVATANATSVGGFIASMKSAEATGYVATYHVKNLLFFQDGTINFAQIPSPPGTKAVENTDGYSGTGKYSYIFYGSSDHVIRQWIVVNTNVQACLKWASGPQAKLICGRPSPYLPSNGFIEEDTGLIPKFVLQAVQESESTPTVDRFTLESSKEFGQLRCLTQASWSQTTCIDRSGYVVSYRRIGISSYITDISLATLGHHPSAANFAPLVKPTVALVLPPI
jgi:hypothetical protein